MSRGNATAVRVPKRGAAALGLSVSRAEVQPTASGQRIYFTVLGPPRGKQRARVFRDSRTGKTRACTPKETAQYEQAVARVADFTLMRGLRDWSKQGRYSLRIVVAYGDNQRRDIDNVLKSVADGCNGVLWDDDSQVHHMAVTRVFEGEPRTEVIVEVMP